MTQDSNTIMIVILIVLCFILLIMNNKSQKNIESFYDDSLAQSELSTNQILESPNIVNTGGTLSTDFGDSTDAVTTDGVVSRSINNLNSLEIEQAIEKQESLPSEKKGLEPITDNINLNIKVVTIAKDYNGIQVSFKKKNLNSIKYYLHIYRLDKDGNELTGQGSYLLVGLDPKEDKEVRGRLISNPIPIKHPKAEKFIIALQYTYKDENGITNESGYEFPNNLVNQNKIFNLNKPIEDQVAEYKSFEEYLEQKEQIEESKFRKEEDKNRLISNADGTFNVEKIEKSLGGFPDNLFLDQSSISSLDELINRNLKLGIFNVNAHISENVYQ